MGPLEAERGQWEPGNLFEWVPFTVPRLNASDQFPQHGVHVMIDGDMTEIKKLVRKPQASQAPNLHDKAPPVNNEINNLMDDHICNIH